MKILSAFCVVLLIGLFVSETFGQSVEQVYKPKAAAIIQPKAHMFMAGEVKLLSGPFKESQDAAAKVLLGLDVDRLLFPFLTEAGLKPKAESYRGWEIDILPGVGLSFYLSGISRLYMMTGNQEFLDRINYVLSELERCQDKNSGYLLGVRGGKEIFARIEKEGYFTEYNVWGNGAATPYYSLEKLLSGLRDVYRVTHNPKALQISEGIGKWLVKHMSFINEHELQRLMGVEYGGMNWLLADLYADTNDKRYLDMSRRWQDSACVVPMTKGNDVLTGKHANMQFPMISGLAARYRFSGDPSDLFGARFFWENVVKYRTYPTGGNSESEHFKGRGEIASTLTTFTEENCNVYNMLRLTALLYETEPRVEYADFMERALFNHILSAQNRKNGDICYFLSLMSGSEKFHAPLYEFPCCVCSGFDSYTKHAEYIYSHNETSLFVNLFIASEVNFKEKAITIKQETNFPESETSKLTFSCSKPVTFELCIRNPYWANNKTTIKINGKPLKSIASDDGYFHISREWKNGDVVELHLPMNLRAESAPDNPEMVSLFNGPVLLAGQFNEEQSMELVMNNSTPAIITGNKPVSEWLKQAASPLTFTTIQLKPEQVNVIPFYKITEGAYSVFWKKQTETEWLQSEKSKQQKAEVEKKINSITIDKVAACDSVSETRHKLKGVTTTGHGNEGILDDYAWRTLGQSPDNEFSYEMKVSDTSPNVLYFTFMGRGPYESWKCNITVDGVTIKSLQQSNVREYPVELRHETYAIPPELTKGKNNVRVGFVPIDKVVPGQYELEYIVMPRVVEIRTIKN